MPSVTSTNVTPGTAGRGLRFFSGFSILDASENLWFPRGLTPSVCPGPFGGERRGGSGGPVGPHALISLNLILMTTRWQQAHLSVDGLTGSEDESLVHSHSVGTWESPELEARGCLSTRPVLFLNLRERELSGTHPLVHSTLSVPGPSAG